MDRISLCGIWACGKSVVGKGLAERTGWEHRDLDQEVARLYGGDARSLPREGFFELEHIILKQLTQMPRAVISLGSGTLATDVNPYHAQNAELLDATTYLVSLEADRQTLIARYVSDLEQNTEAAAYRRHEPDIKLAFMERAERFPYHRQVSRLTLDTTNLTVAQSVEAVLGHYKYNRIQGELEKAEDVLGIGPVHIPADEYPGGHLRGHSSDVALMTYRMAELLGCCSPESILLGAQLHDSGFLPWVFGDPHNAPPAWLKQAHPELGAKKSIQKLIQAGVLEGYGPRNIEDLVGLDKFAPLIMIPLLHHSPELAAQIGGDAGKYVQAAMIADDYAAHGRDYRGWFPHLPLEEAAGLAVSKAREYGFDEKVVGAFREIYSG